MATIQSSMKHDIEMAGNSLPEPENDLAGKPDNAGAVPFGAFPEKALPAEEEKLMLEPADKSDDAIKDDYAGNVSYRILKDSKKRIAAAREKSAGQDAVFANKPESDSLDIEMPGAEEDRREEGGKIFSYMEDMKNIAGRIPSGLGMMGKEGEHKKIRSAADAKDKIIARFGKKGAVAGLAAILLAVGTFYALWSRELAEKTDMSGDVAANLPPVKEDVSKIADSNDAIRLANLTVLANVAVLYHIEHGADLPVSREYIKLNEANPVTEFLQDALRRYAQPEDTMHDPRHPDFYYAYRSADGNSIELTARLEDPASSSQCKHEDVCIYRKIITEEDLDNMSDHIERYEP